MENHLIWDANSLLKQSRHDRRGMPNADGWGIGYYDGTAPVVERQIKAAFQDDHFTVTAQIVQSQTILAHIRDASVGGIRLSNTHPFLFGYWMFAHNGTVTGFEQVAPGLEQETDPDLLRHRRGETDSELVFFWLLSKMRREGLHPELRCPELPALVRLQAEVLRELEQRCQQAAPDDPPKLNFLLTDGVIMTATRWRHTLHWTTHAGEHEILAGGIPYELETTASEYRAVIIASEPTSDDVWHEISDFSVFAVDAQLQTWCYPVLPPLTRISPQAKWKHL
ncbi:MAG: class II glutamine amidotransferase [Gemmataceae bacterium]